MPNTIYIPVRVNYTNRQYGADRAVEVMNKDVDAAFSETQEWRLESLRIEGDIREDFDVDGLQESQNIGAIEVNPETLDWEFHPEESLTSSR